MEEKAICFADQQVQPPKQVRLVVLPNPRKQLERNVSPQTPCQSKLSAKVCQSRKKRRSSSLREPVGKENWVEGWRRAPRHNLKKSCKDKMLSSALLDFRGRSAVKHTIQGGNPPRTSLFPHAKSLVILAL